MSEQIDGPHTSSTGCGLALKDDRENADSTENEVARRGAHSVCLERARRALARSGWQIDAGG
ncbi:MULTISPECIES: hypothetical protein [Prauserella]|uniref:Ferredoxin n=1 Tax=Prauserella endophytica TaxID=1592324 RepID=A0ABY2S9D1_9PSEU|nr:MULTISPECIES: hypothetical protein [Prauserella]TKG72517.1 hypothetical protein FCN18_04495 [Prauserella endophytica]